MVAEFMDARVGGIIIATAFPRECGAGQWGERRTQVSCEVVRCQLRAKKEQAEE